MVDRAPVSFLSVMMCFVTFAAAAEVRSPSPQQLEALRTAWHDCVRAAFAERSGSSDKLSAEQSALQACKSAEDGYVAAELARREAASANQAHRGFGARARAWAASVASYVVDPVIELFGSRAR